MGLFQDHIHSLIGFEPPSGTSTVSDDLYKEWASAAAQSSSSRQDIEDLDTEPEWTSIVSLYTHDATPVLPHSANNVAHSVVDRLQQNPHLQLLIPIIISLLSSDKSDNMLSEELLEAIGFENIDLVGDLIQNRKAVSELLGLPPNEQAKVLSKSSLSELQQGAPLDPFNDARRRMEETLQANASRPLWTAEAEQAAEVLPHVYSSSAAQSGYLSQYGTKYSISVDHKRVDHEAYEEVTLPPAKPVPPKLNERLIPVSELDPLAKGSFPGYTNLNRIQSIVYPTAYKSNENMLVCAPTGAGKTDVAMLTILRVLDQFRDHGSSTASIASTIERNKFKIIYVAPMKALASEITRKLGKRLHWLSIRVRELTGDMQMTKAEIAETQIIVTTPEKWDVVTRKPTGEGEVAAMVKLLIIDEVHLLNGDRGAVVETIVARTLRQVESTQSVIRIVGLSATLPNYRDVAEFLSVSPYNGLFYFDSSFRPVPLEQHFLGVKGKPGSALSKKNLDSAVFEKVLEIVRQGHQVMVFVHARKETVKTATSLKEEAHTEGALLDFSCEEHPQWSAFRRQIGESRNKEMKQLFDHGFGIHHAGMLRSDRNMMEHMFEARAIKVLCTTATLAWGVNLPAHAVIIKGTQVYDSARGSFVDLSVLDVLQIFGRAGRPGLETEGEGYICTTEDKMDYYLQAITSQHPIESKFTTGLVDSLNAEIALGTVANVRDAVQWLGYTYMYVRMRKNPLVYGVPYDEVTEDPRLGGRRTQLVIAAAKKLADCRMIAYDSYSGSLTITDLGRIAAKYYIRHASIEIFNKEFRVRMTEADVLTMLAKSTEFDQIQLRENEVKELEVLLKDAPCEVKGGTNTSQGKANILLQAYISGAWVEDFALVSDSAYVAQNSGRIIRALLEIALSRKWANVSFVMMSMSKAIEKRIWPFDHPLKQFPLKADVLYNLEKWAGDYEIVDLAAMSGLELGDLIHFNEKHGTAVLNASRELPSLDITYNLRPLGSEILKLLVQVSPAFKWNPHVHGSSEPFWLWVEDMEGGTVLQLVQILIRADTRRPEFNFVISIPHGRPPTSVTIRAISDRWMGAENEVSVPLEGLHMPSVTHSHTPRLDIPFLQRSTIQNPKLESALASRLFDFNAIQSQVFWSIVKTYMHGLVCGPTGCGKSVISLILLCNTISKPGNRWALVVAPHHSIAAEIVSDLRLTCRVMGLRLQLVVAGDSFEPFEGRGIKVISASNLPSVLSRVRSNEVFTNLQLVVCENIEQLNATYELGVSLLRHATQAEATRFVGFSASLDDPADLAAWLDVHPFALHSFRPRDRDQSLAVTIQTFTIPHSAALIKAMVKPCHAAINANASETAMIFVPSRSQCRPIALGLITQATLESETGRAYTTETIPEEVLDQYVGRLRDHSLRDFISNGVGFFHDGIHRDDRKLMMQLYSEGMIRVIILSREACWTAPIRAGTVVVMGTQYLHIDSASGERQVQDYSHTEIVRMQSRAVRHNELGRFHLFCQAESKDTYARFLDDGLPLESELIGSDALRHWYGENRRNGNIPSKQAALDVLSWTFLARRIETNPVYYDSSVGETEASLSRIVDDLDDSLSI